MVGRAATVAGLDAADLNYPDHFADHAPDAARALLARHGMALNGLAMRYYTHPGYRLGAFTNPDPSTRRAAIDETKRGIDALLAMGGRLMTLWLGQDGVDYSFQGDYGRMWDDTIAAIAEVADHAPGVDIALEYKPNEPRAYALMPDQLDAMEPRVRELLRLYQRCVDDGVWPGYGTEITPLQLPDWAVRGEEATDEV